MAVEAIVSTAIILLHPFPSMEKRTENSFENAHQLVLETFQLVEEAVFHAFGHIAGTFALQFADARLLVGRIVHLMLADVLPNAKKLVGSILPLVHTVVLAFVLQLVREILQLSDGMLLG